MPNPLAGYVNLNTLLVFIVYSLNFLMLVGAIAMIYICLSDTRQKDIMENIDINFEFLVFFTKIFLVIAVIVALVALLGCVGIAIDNDYMLIAYIVTIGLLMVAQIILTTYITHSVAGSKEDIRKKILDLIKGYTKESPNKLDGFQTKYSCCGIDSYHDYEIKGEHWFIPGSCCYKKPQETCTQDLVHSKKGCNNAILDEISHILRWSYIIIFIVFGLEVVLAICTVLVILDIGQPAEDNTSDEIAMVSSIKKKFPKNDSKFEESIDTHDSQNIQSPIVKEEEVEGLYDEEKVIQKTTEDDAQHDEESHEIKNDTNHNDNAGETLAEGEIHPQEFRGDETIKEENTERKTHDEEIFLEGNSEQTIHGEQTTDKTRTESDDVQKQHDKSDDETEEEEEEEEEDESSVPDKQTKFEENIHVLKTKRFEKKKYVEKVRKERNRDRKRFK